MLLGECSLFRLIYSSPCCACQMRTYPHNSPELLNRSLPQNVDLQGLVANSVNARGILLVLLVETFRIVEIYDKNFTLIKFGYPMFASFIATSRIAFQILLLLATIAINCAAMAEDQYEPNNSASTANLI